MVIGLDVSTSTALSHPHAKQGQSMVSAMGYNVEEGQFAFHTKKYRVRLALGNSSRDIEKSSFCTVQYIYLVCIGLMFKCWNDKPLK